MYKHYAIHQMLKHIYKHTRFIYQHNIDCVRLALSYNLCSYAHSHTHILKFVMFILDILVAALCNIAVCLCVCVYCTFIDWQADVIGMLCMAHVMLFKLLFLFFS